MDKYYEAELNVVLGRIDKLEIVQLQFFSIFGTAILTMLGLAISQKNSILIFLGAFLLSIAIVVESRIRKQSQIFYYRGLQLQRKLSNNDPEVFLELHTSMLAKEAKTILIHDSLNERVNALAASKAHRTGIYILLPMVIVVALIVVASVMHFLYQW